MLPKVADKQRRVSEVDVFITETTVSHARREQEEYNESAVAQTWWNYGKINQKQLIKQNIKAQQNKKQHLTKPRINKASH